MNDSSGRSSRMGIKDSITSVNPLSSCPWGDWAGVALASYMNAMKMLIARARGKR